MVFLSAMVPPPRRAISRDSRSKASPSLVTPSPRAPNISGVSAPLPAGAGAAPQDAAAGRPISDAAPPTSSDRLERQGSSGGFGRKIAFVMFRQILVEANAPVAHHVQPAQVQLPGEQPLRGRPRRGIFGGEIVGMDRNHL